MARRVSSPVERFLHLEAAGGIVLLIAAAVALIWANSSLAHSYHDLWHTPFVFSVGSIQGSVNLHFFINDVLMTIFFLLAGLEIKREIVKGELSDIRRASLPLAAALGGMLFPAIICFVLNPSAPASSGWGVPMATDIAFALGVMSLLGNRIPAAMRILLLALAIIDDLGAILVIAIFYTADFQMSGLYIAFAGVATLILWLRLGVRPGALYLVPLAIIWAGLFIAGIHPTLAGVIVGLATPVKPWLSADQFISTAKNCIADFEASEKLSPEKIEDNQLGAIKQLHFAAREALSPVTRGQDQMHIWIAFGIMPLFALANAGVGLDGVDFGIPGAMKIMLGISLGLAIGKPLGVLLVSWVFVKLGLASIPKGLTWSSMAVIGMLAGIGFTMAIFIAELAFAGQPALLSLAKLAILIGTGGAAVVGMILGRVLLKPVTGELATLTASDVERSTEY
ncbi:MAG: Na+/H+ antiporter NhaA [Kofleriaceae bacterium]|nr:Na+/H+ antiporter NhaA [Kofleriaceae bacterium]